MPEAAWERQPGEGMAEFAAFEEYLDLGPQRTIHASMQHHLSQASHAGHNGHEPSKWQRRYLTHPKPRTYLRSVYDRWRIWSSRFAWRKRAAAYDDYNAYIGRKAHLEAEAARSEADAAEENRQARMALQEARSLRAIAARIQGKILEVLRDDEALAGLTIRRQKVVAVSRALGPDGKPTGEFRRTEITTPGVLDLLPISAQANQIGQQLERLILGLVTDRTVVLSPEDEKRQALARITQRAIEEEEQRILREREEGDIPGGRPRGAGEDVWGTGSPEGVETPESGNGSAEGGVEGETGEAE